VLAENSGAIPDADFVDLDVLESELRALIGSFYDGSLFQNSYLSATPPEKRVLKDITFSGDGEPTLSPQFAEAVHRIAAIRKELCDESVKIVLITNGTTLHSNPVRAALRQLLGNDGEIWAKLDAGTPEFFRLVSRSSLSYETLINNLFEFTKEFPVVIQTCFMLLHGKRPGDEEIRRYAEQLRRCDRILRVQIYTVARSTPESWVTPLFKEQLDEIAGTVRQLTGLIVQTFYAS
jgi:wyosine [tRNA(Phe)-imidazoG37] synthetase (radical SAM superfamily)